MRTMRTIFLTAGESHKILSFKELGYKIVLDLSSSDLLDDVDENNPKFCDFKLPGNCFELSDKVYYTNKNCQIKVIKPR